MMKTTLRSVAAVIVGLTAVFVLLVAVELFSAVVHPFPEGFTHTPEEMCRHVEKYPDWVLAVVVPMWGATAYVGTWIAKRIGSIYSMAVVGLLLIAGVILNISMLPYPIWFKVTIVIVVPVAIVAAGRSPARRREPAAELNAA